jgi:acetoacetate decarboxylase
MKEDIRQQAYAMPFTSPAFPRGPYRFNDREYLVITYRTDVDKLRAVVPEPWIDPDRPFVKYEFMRMPDSTGFGDYTESGQVIPVSFQGAKAATAIPCSSTMTADRRWAGVVGLSQAGQALPEGRTDCLVGTLDYGPVRVATATMGYKHRPLELDPLLASLATPNFLLKIIHVDGTAYLRTG